ncbi:unnamed protein product [Clavelina lepadiformis]|uniref:Thrombospondin-like N-terminal domain-containing protein n=1 Tax=Clavelina lepadiformis TaxID=159417 RepID=A0ABP0GIB7_CLALP
MQYTVYFLVKLGFMAVLRFTSAIEQGRHVRIDCNSLHVDDDTSPDFDILSQFNINKGQQPLLGVNTINGTTRYQVAYRLSENALLSIPSSKVLPFGLPSEYSFVSTFRVKQKSNNQLWNLWMVTDKQYGILAGIQIDDRRQLVRFVTRNKQNRTHQVTFSRCAGLFDNGWHKILLAVKNKEVSLYIDCVWIEDVSFNQSYPAMDTKGFVQIGHIVQNTSYSMPIELQWMLIHCDPERAKRETCNELPPKVSI